MEDLTVTCSKLELGLCQLSLHLHAEGVLNRADPTLGSKLETKGFGRKKFPIWPRGSHTKVVHNLSFEVYFCCAPLEREGKKK